MVCFLAPRGADSKASGRKRRTADAGRADNDEGANVGGVCFGCFLGSLVAYLRHTPPANGTAPAPAGCSAAFIARQVEAVLCPIAAQAVATRGADARHLCAALASSRMLRQQQQMLDIANSPAALAQRSLRHGHPSVVIGAAAAIFVVFSVLSSKLLFTVDPEQLATDVAWFVSHRALDKALEAVEVATNGFLIKEEELDATTPAFELAAVEAEHRCIQRARRGVASGVTFAMAHGLPAEATFRTALHWFLRAAWPAGVLLTARTHGDVMGLLEAPDFYLAMPETVASEGETLELVPLAQLSGLSSDGGGARVGGGSFASDSDASSVLSSSGGRRTLSSAASSAGDGGADAGDLGIETLLLDAILAVRPTDFHA